MALKVKYSPLMLRRAAEMISQIEKESPSGREDYAQRKFGLSLNYLRKIGRVHLSPSGRVLDNMGFEVWVRDPRTGEQEKLEFDYKYDWTPRDPRPKKARKTD